jgi:gamma-butyrobetaine dioxygenase
LFDVKTKPEAIDLAYTGNALSAHTDNPYRRPVPGIQMLHCLETTVEGGRSTLVDGAAVLDALAEEMPDALDALETVPIRFVYDSAVSSFETLEPMIERDTKGRLRILRFSPRLDYVAPVDTETLDRFYRGRRRLFELAGDAAFRIEFRLEPGMLLMMDNYRLMHGRTTFDSAAGFRHLQGCYIDHDGPESLYRMLAQGVNSTAVGREVA